MYPQNHVIPDRAKPQRYQSALAMEALYQQDPTLLNNLYMLDETTYTIHWRPAPHTQVGVYYRSWTTTGGSPLTHFLGLQKQTLLEEKLC